MENSAEHPNKTLDKEKEREIFREPAVIFTDAVREALSNYGNLQGRSRRSEYWFFLIFVLLLYCFVFLFGWLTSFLDGNMYVVRNFFLGLVFATTITPLITVSVRRLHDIGISGWALLPIGLLTGGIGMLLLAIKDSDKDRNRFGENPKGLNWRQKNS